MEAAEKRAQAAANASAKEALRKLRAEGSPLRWALAARVADHDIDGLLRVTRERSMAQAHDAEQREACARSMGGRGGAAPAGGRRGPGAGGPPDSTRAEHLRSLRPIRAGPRQGATASDDDGPARSCTIWLHGGGSPGARTPAMDAGTHHAAWVIRSRRSAAEWQRASRSPARSKPSPPLASSKSYGQGRGAARQSGKRRAGAIGRSTLWAQWLGKPRPQSTSAIVPRCAVGAGSAALKTSHPAAPNSPTIGWPRASSLKPPGPTPGLAAQVALRTHTPLGGGAVPAHSGARGR